MKKLLLIDANSLIHRAFHALPSLTSPSGEPTGALFGLAGALVKIMKEQNPDYIAAAFDRPEPTFRKEMFADYKAHRPKAPNELVQQLIGAHELFKQFGVATFEEKGFEADDVIGTLAMRFSREKDLRVYILTGDLDALQLVNDDSITVITPKKGVSETVEYNEAAVRERYGLSPAQIPDYKGLVGDASDNIPGVKGIGPKTAASLLQEFGTLETLFKKLGKNDKRAPKILPFEKEALFSKKLGTIRTDAPITPSLAELLWSREFGRDCIAYLEQKGFTRIIARIEGTQKTTPPSAYRPHIKEDAPRPIEGFDVAWEWKTRFKELLRAREKLPEKPFDCEVAGWLLEPDQSNLSPETLLQKYSRGADRGKNNELEEVFAALRAKLAREGLERVCYDIEMPLIEVLANMELWGIALDDKKLGALLEETTKELAEAAKTIYRETGVVFNLNSPQQVGEVLFKKLGIQTAKIKKTRTGRLATSEDILTSLRDTHPAVAQILSYRETFKIKSTYLEPLLALRDADGRLHTTFAQTGTSTGRISSEKPNLQNIPQESRWSKPLRRAFVAEHGWSFYSLDYSQLELRLLAHITKDENLLRAFRNREDIHSLTASRVLGIPESAVTPELRRIGKTLNFGMIYGMGVRAFAKTSGITNEKAAEFIQKYFEGFPNIRVWQENAKAEAEKKGYAENINGRKRWFSGSRNKGYRVFGEVERAAMNMPIQSLEADILKMAMRRTYDFLKTRGWLGTHARPILTIHDELLFEIRDDILKQAVGPLKNIMERVFPLDIPLVVEGKTGKDWGSLEA